MSKGLEAFEMMGMTVDVMCSTEYNDAKKIVEKELKACETIKELFDFSTALRFPDNQPMLMIVNKRKNEYWEIPLTKEQYESMKEALE